MKYKITLITEDTYDVDIDPFDFIEEENNIDFNALAIHLVTHCEWEEHYPNCKVTLSEENEKIKVEGPIYDKEN